MSWNCLGKLSTNFAHLLAMQPDVAVLVEAGASPPVSVEGLTWVSAATMAGSAKHIMAVARAPWSVEPHPAAATSRQWVLPVRVRGPVEFTLVAVHTFGGDGQPSYAAQVGYVANTLLNQLAGEVVVAGDFNTPITSSLAAHLRNDAAFNAWGLESAFVAARGVTVREAYALAGGAPGIAWREPTYFHLRRPGAGFHIDHVYAPSSWLAPPLQVSLGTYEAWVASRRSDHVPVRVDFASPSGGRG